MGFRLAINVDTAKEMANGLDNTDRSDQRQIGIALQERLHDLLDLCDRCHRLWPDFRDNNTLNFAAGPKRLRAISRIRSE